MNRVNITARFRSESFQNFSSRGILLLLVLLFVFLPLSKGLTSTIIGILGIVSIPNVILKKTWNYSRPYLDVFALTLMLIILLLSVLYSEDKTKGMQFIYRQGTFLILPLIFIAQARSIQKNSRKLVSAFILANIFAAFVTIFFFLISEDSALRITEQLPVLQEYVVHKKRFLFGLYSPFIDRLHFSYLLSLSFLSLLWFFKEGFRWKYFLGLVLLGIMILLLGGRGAQIALVVCTLVWIVAYYFILLHPKISIKINKLFSISFLIFIIVFCGIGLPFLAYKTVPPVKNRYNQLKWELGLIRSGEFVDFDYEHFTSLSRIMSWKNNGQIIHDNPVFGVGIGDYHHEMQKIYNKQDLGLEVHTQNQFLFMWAAAGIPGLLILLSIYFWWMYKAVKSRNIWYTVYSISIVLFFFLVSNLDALLHFQTGITCFALFLCLLIFLPQATESDSQ